MRSNDGVLGGLERNQRLGAGVVDARHQGEARAVVLEDAGRPAHRSALAQCLGDLELESHRPVDVDQLTVLTQRVEKFAEILKRHARDSRRPAPRLPWRRSRASVFRWEIAHCRSPAWARRWSRTDNGRRCAGISTRVVSTRALAARRRARLLRDGLEEVPDGRRYRPGSAKAVEPDRVHRSVYTDPAIFELEMERIFETVWIYCGHESAGAEARRLLRRCTIGRQPMIMVRGKPTAACSVLYNRCPHRGISSCGDRRATPASASSAPTTPGASTSTASCSAIPLDKGYDGTRMTHGQPRLQHEAGRARRELPRLRVRQPGRRRAVAARVPRRRPRSPSTTCATARRRARSRSCRSASA